MPQPSAVVGGGILFCGLSFVTTSVRHATFVAMSYRNHGYIVLHRTAVADIVEARDELTRFCRSKD